MTQMFLHGDENSQCVMCLEKGEKQVASCVNNCSFNACEECVNNMINVTGIICPYHRTKYVKIELEQGNIQPEQGNIQPEQGGYDYDNAIGEIFFSYVICLFWYCLGHCGCQF